MTREEYPESQRLTGRQEDRKEDGRIIRGSAVVVYPIAQRQQPRVSVVFRRSVRPISSRREFSKVRWQLGACSRNLINFLSSNLPVAVSLAVGPRVAH